MELFQSNTNRVMIVAELSANHNHDLDIALRTVRAAKECGADAIKIQTYTPDTLTINCDNEYFRIDQGGGLWDGKTLYELYAQAYTPWEWHPMIKAEAERVGLDFFSTPFDASSVDFLSSLNVQYYKIASFEIFDIPLISYIAKQNKPIIISTGMATLADIELAVNTCREAGNNQITLLKCTSSYPAPIEEANLLTIPNISETFGVEVGLSDHTMGMSVALAAVALGATLIEKHFILDRNIGGPDASFSMNPDEFGAMVKGIREVEASLGKVSYELSANVNKSKIFARSLFIVADVAKGELVTSSNIRSIRPGFGLHPKYLPEVLGKKFRLAIKKGTPLSTTMIE